MRSLKTVQRNKQKQVNNRSFEVSLNNQMLRGMENPSTIKVHRSQLRETEPDGRSSTHRKNVLSLSCFGINCIFTQVNQVRELRSR